ncbi:hypothetical protein V6R21_05820 [Limibacter armeniacum]|uniref:hypothetical protein n=1 Tax=Limibacter armeniacum TaxID=466084 RepID=UPI002FE5C76F
MRYTILLLFSCLLFACSSDTVDLDGDNNPDDSLDKKPTRYLSRVLENGKVIRELTKYDSYWELNFTGGIYQYYFNAEGQITHSKLVQDSLNKKEREYHYNDNGLLTDIFSYDLGDGTKALTLAYTFSYDGNGVFKKLVRERAANKYIKKSIMKMEVTSYDEHLQPTSLHITGYTNGEVTYTDDVEYVYDDKVSTYFGLPAPITLQISGHYTPYLVNNFSSFTVKYEDGTSKKVDEVFTYDEQGYPIQGQGGNDQFKYEYLPWN